jgi:hypothetical protein
MQIEKTIFSAPMAISTTAGVERYSKLFLTKEKTEIENDTI